MRAYSKEFAELSRAHGMEMHRNSDAAHLEAMQKMQELMGDPAEMEQWYESKRQEFDSLPDIDT